MRRGLRTKYRPIELGLTVSEGAPVLFTEEDFNNHLHILGSPGEGKSTAIELILRHLIDEMVLAEKDPQKPRRPGFLLLDPGEYGDTYYRVLRYCMQAGWYKVCIIDPHDIYEKAHQVVPTINPFRYDANASDIIHHVEDTLRALWGGAREEERRLEKFVAALIAVIHADRKTIAEFEYFTAFDNPAWERLRTQMMQNRRLENRHRAYLHDVFKTQNIFDRNFQPVANFVQPFLDPTIKLMFGSQESPINFSKLVADGYVTLVNLNPTGLFRPLEQRLLGVAIVNEFVRAIEQMRWYYPLPFTIFIDEIGIFANPKITYLLDYKRKSYVRLVMAHQRWNQIKDHDLTSALYGGSVRNHLVFHTEEPEDRDRMVKLMYGGALPDREVSYNLKESLLKQRAVVGLNRKTPAITRIKNVPPVSAWTLNRISDFKHYIFHNSPISHFYRSKGEVEKEINNRFAPSPQTRFTGGRIPREKPSVPPPDNSSPAGKSIFDRYADSEAVLQPKKRRTTRKTVSPPPEAG